jgi:putative FmdB family regulatory protein
MPIYEYRCNGCEKTFEVIQKFSDDPIKECIHCSGKKVVKLISQSSFILKGGGWHKDGYSTMKEVKSQDKGSDKTPSKPDCSSCPSSSSNN